jgi:hypothetical protein
LQALALNFLAADDVAAIIADVASRHRRDRRPGTSTVQRDRARYLKRIGDPREVVRDPEARYFGGRVEERSLVPLGEARLGRIGLDEWLCRSQARA